MIEGVVFDVRLMAVMKVKSRWCSCYDDKHGKQGREESDGDNDDGLQGSVSYSL